MRKMVGVRGHVRVLIGVVALAIGWTCVEAKTPGKTYCFLGVCHRVKSLAETRRLVGKPMTLMASHYDDAKRDRFNPSNLTSSGAYFRAGRPDNAASPIFPDGTILLVWNPATRKAVVVRVDNAGPYFKNRKLDLSRAAARKLGFGGRGVARVVVKVLKAPTRAEARYRRGRRYKPVAGYIGSFASLAQATQRAGRGYGLRRGAGLVQVAGLTESEGGNRKRVKRPRVTMPRRKPFLLAVLARAEQKGKWDKDKMDSGGVPSFDLRGAYPASLEHRNDAVRARSMVLSSLAGSRSGLLRVPHPATQKRDVAHKRIQLAAVGRPRLDPPAPVVVSRSGAVANARHKTYGSGGVKSVSAGLTSPRVPVSSPVE